MQTPDDAEALSLVAPIGYSSTEHCGYCKGSRAGYSYYAVATSLTPQFYQALVDRSWRRSGRLLYRPNQKDACCPHYTLRLDSTQFKPTKDQRQAVNRFNRFVTGDAYSKEAARRYPLSREEARRRDTEFNLVERIREGESQCLPTPPAPAHDFTVTLEPDTYTEEKYAVYENYQRIVHEEPPEKISPHGFRRFLCESPVTRQTVVAPNGHERQLGSYHQCYRLDGQLVAIGVLDLLPEAVSAVYFLYHESVHRHNPGKLGALREIAWAAEAGYRWWYPGYYIHGCPKMRYKMDYAPQYLLDPETLQWDLLDADVLALFDRRAYVSLSKERAGLSDEDGMAAEHVQEMEVDDTRKAPNAEGKGDEGADADMELEIDDEAEEEEDEEDEDLEDAFLLTSNMPAIPSLEVMKQLNMDGLRLRSDYADGVFLTSDLVAWPTDDMCRLGGLKSRIAELIAAIGPDLMDEICLDFRRASRI